MSVFQFPKTRRSRTRDRSVKLLCMKPISVAEILGLQVQERIRLVELIWESIAAVPESVEVTPELGAELEARLKEFETDPEAGYSWDQVRSHLRDGTWSSA
jgi:putative addiction module component (TIGR02574 family)